MLEPSLSSLGLWGLFLSAFTSATLLPGSSEIALLYLASQGTHPTPLLWASATAGNTLGGMTSWLLGWLAQKKLRRPRPDEQKAIAYIERWGSLLLLLSWLPVIGDGICLAAGWLRIHPLRALLLIAIGKGARYGALLMFV